MKLYAGAEDADGYYRDGCVYRNDIDIYDSMQAIVKYSNGATMAYSLDAHMPFEGYRVAFNGELGRLEVRDHERQPWEVPEADETEIYVTKSFGLRRACDVRAGRRRPRRRRRLPARPDLPPDAGARAHESARLARRRAVVPHRHRRAQEHRREARGEDLGARQADVAIFHASPQRRQDAGLSA